MAPGVDSLFINWAFQNPAHILSARLDLYYLSTAGIAHLWTKTISWNPGDCPAVGSTPFTGRLDDNEEQRFASQSQNVTVAYHPSPAFPTDHLNVQQAPYKLEMTVVSVTGANLLTRQRWLYIDVVVDSIELSLGSSKYIPKPTGVGDKGFNRRNLEVYSHLDVQLPGRSFPAGKGLTFPRINSRSRCTSPMAGGRCGISRKRRTPPLTSFPTRSPAPART
ncbi:hypothetical protein [Hyalangium versicolor]|uniref:hypothetical protein n=1 Tax=Hyalangium versicolor TaxID=2861190 RepID=UPI001CCD66FE|nr:hypothetical protein [Hyalangium versicolor]